MKKRLSKKLSLNRETIRRLSDPRLGVAVGGAPTNGNTCADTCGCNPHTCDTSNHRLSTASLYETRWFC